MEPHYQTKHIFQGTSRGEVFVRTRNNHTEVQGTFSWD